jgi:hypothetical protein
VSESNFAEAFVDQSKGLLKKGFPLEKHAWFFVMYHNPPPGVGNGQDQNGARFDRGLRPDENLEVEPSTTVFPAS